MSIIDYVSRELVELILVLKTRLTIKRCNHITEIVPVVNSVMSMKWLKTLKF